ncbi:hypothetical protein PHYSODRAFT_507170 [Phytophthora sojae]|uniref:S-adenosyl-L-methionine-dependent methyltransferase n=1 Tax=Phytophthora sojae (strain P6497) TaxID=1094619 RepID=G4ZMT3_PHYSP|nr:hypothetical protein PHYSODRAFT_507170 [Phytophthora sojae]EGZ16053.1 hypothetical protein PHYSODRAFT_507170 [Phytophthora sojae]|eukprot:XP_009529802.1 hypothetical protein PHYSODRAFT_507170 [Phytophthora sojae]
MNVSCTAANSFTELTGFGTAYMRAIESARDDCVYNDPFAGLLTQRNRNELEKFLKGTAEQGVRWENLIAIRSRYVDDALEHRGSGTKQVVILGAGLDTRAYRLLSLRECHVLEIEQNSQAFDHKAEVLQDAPLMARKLDCIVANLADDDWDHKLLAHGFDSSLPTFWVMEGLLPHMDRSSITTMLDTVDALSAPGSELWADIAGHATFAVEGFGDVTMKYAEDDPLHGVLREIPWCLKLQASLGEEGVHFGRKSTPLSSSDTGESVPVWFVVGKKPIPTEAREKDVCPGLDYGGSFVQRI